MPRRKISIATKPDPSVWETNVWGTQNILDLAKEHAIDRMIYIGSVHAIQEKAGIMTEPLIFDPHLVVGQYAKSKAEAIRRVLASDLRVVVLLPSGIIGPGGCIGTESYGPSDSSNDEKKVAHHRFGWV